MPIVDLSTLSGFLSDSNRHSTTHVGSLNFQERNAQVGDTHHFGLLTSPNRSHLTN